MLFSYVACVLTATMYERNCVIQWKGTQIERNWIAMFVEISSWGIRSSCRYHKKLCLHNGLGNDAESLEMDDFFMVHF